MSPFWRLPTGRVRSCLLLLLAVLAFVLLIELTPIAPKEPWLAIGIFCGLLGLFKIMGQFEKPA